MSIRLQWLSMLRLEPECGKLKAGRPRRSLRGRVYWSQRIDVPKLPMFFLRRFSSWCPFNSQSLRDHFLHHQGDLIGYCLFRVGNVGDLVINSIGLANGPTTVDGLCPA